MNDNNKIKKELIEELDELKGRSSTVKEKPGHILSDFTDREDREELKAQIEFVADVDVLVGEGINISKNRKSRKVFNALDWLA